MGFSNRCIMDDHTYTDIENRTVEISGTELYRYLASFPSNTTGSDGIGSSTAPPIGPSGARFKCMIFFPYSQKKTYDELITGDYYKDMDIFSAEYLDIYLSKHILSSEAVKEKKFGITPTMLPCIHLRECGGSYKYEIIQLKSLGGERLNDHITRVIRAMVTQIEFGSDLHGIAKTAREEITKIMAENTMLSYIYVNDSAVIKDSIIDNPENIGNGNIQI